MVHIAEKINTWLIALLNFVTLGVLNVLSFKNYFEIILIGLTIVMTIIKIYQLLKKGKEK